MQMSLAMAKLKAGRYDEARSVLEAALKSARLFNSVP